ncbi:hypothetical protein WMY93_003932 [Mugilogobius chulae]|uniref:Uncharacterized protein n=1 Tax=Mugilogobius chulae TaxID=88201 RepID=A0AAW0Q3T7_9GOBI
MEAGGNGASLRGLELRTDGAVLAIVQPSPSSSTASRGDSRLRHGFLSLQCAIGPWHDINCTPTNEWRYGGRHPRPSVGTG